MNETQTTTPPIINSEMPTMQNAKPPYLKVGLKIIGSLLILGICIFAYVTYANPFVGYSPQEIVGKSIQKSIEDTRVAALSDENGNFEAAITTNLDVVSMDAAMPFTFKTTIPMKVLGEVENEKITFSVSTEDFDISSIIKNLGIEASGAQNLSAEMRAFQDTNKGYVRISKIPPALGMVLGDVTPILNKWFVFDVEDIDGFSDVTDATEMTKEMEEKIVASVMRHLNETAEPKIVIENVSVGRKISYTFEAQKFDHAMDEIVKEIGDIMGTDLAADFIDDDVSDAELEGDVKLTFVIDRSFVMQNAEVHIDMPIEDEYSSGRVVIDMAISESGLITGHFEVSAEGLPIVTGDIKASVVFGEDKKTVEKISLEIDASTEIVKFGLDMEALYTFYTDKRILVPENAQSIETLQ